MSAAVATAAAPPEHTGLVLLRNYIVYRRLW